MIKVNNSVFCVIALSVLSIYANFIQTDPTVYFCIIVGFGAVLAILLDMEKDGERPVVDKRKL